MSLDAPPTQLVAQPASMALQATTRTSRQIRRLVTQAMDSGLHPDRHHSDPETIPLQSQVDRVVTHRMDLGQAVARQIHGAQTAIVARTQAVLVEVSVSIGAHDGNRT